MICIKLPYKTDTENISFIADLRRKQSNIIRFIYCRLEEGYSRKEIAEKCKSKFDMDTWFIQSSFIKASSLYKVNKDKKTKHIWGGKKNFLLRTNGKITSEQYRAKRLLKLHIEGEAPQKGNRKFELKIQNDEKNLIVFKPYIGKKVILALSDKIHKNYLEKLITLQELAKDKQLPYTVELDEQYIYISFQLNETDRLKSIIKRTTTKSFVRQNAKDKLEKLTEKNNKNSHRIMGLDLNPNWIGISVLQFDQYDKFKTIHKEVIDLCIINSKKTFSNNKKRNETIEITKYIVNLACHFKCNKLSTEELNIVYGDKKKGKTLNRLCNNVWHKNLLMTQLSKRCKDSSIELVKVNPAYSSTVGNILYGDNNTPDMVASSIEIARRGYKKFKKNWFYPEIPLKEELKNRWKEDSKQMEWNSWPELHNQIKNLGLRYRVPLDIGYANAVCSHKSAKSKIKRIEFINL